MNNGLSELLLTVLEKDNGGKIRNRTFCIFFLYIYLFDLEKVVGRFKKKKKDVSKRSKLGGTRARSTSALTK